MLMVADVDDVPLDPAVDEGVADDAVHVVVIRV
jgi:hypothetical protein